MMSNEKNNHVSVENKGQEQVGVNQEEVKEVEGGAEQVSKPVVSQAKSRKKKALQKPVSLGRAYIQATYNNTIVAITDQVGNAIAWSSAGLNGFKGPKKATPYAAGIIVKDAVTKAKERGLKEVHVLVKGVGTGREAAIRAINTNGINILSIKDITPIPHNGCRPKKPRRV